MCGDADCDHDCGRELSCTQASGANNATNDGARRNLSSREATATYNTPVVYEYISRSLFKKS